MNLLLYYFGMAYSRLDEFDASVSLLADLGSLPADDAIVVAEHEPNGYFWEGVAQFVLPEVAESLDFDSEGSLFCVHGARADLEALQTVLEPLMASPTAISAVIEDAVSKGVEFDD